MSHSMREKLAKVIAECGDGGRYPKNSSSSIVAGVQLKLHILFNVQDTAERLRITGEQKGRNLQTLSKLLMGEVVDYIWGCLTCYSVHLSESDLEKHVTEEHQGKFI